MRIVFLQAAAQQMTLPSCRGPASLPFGQMRVGGVLANLLNPPDRPSLMGHCISETYSAQEMKMKQTDDECKKPYPIIGTCLRVSNPTF